LTASQDIIGYSADSGLRKSLEENVATFQKMIGQNHPKLLAGLYKMRMYQNQYIAFQKEEDYKSFQQASTSFKSLLSEAKLDGDMSLPLLKYTNSFKTIHGAFQSMNETSNSFEKTANQVENSVTSIAKQLDQQKTQLSDQQSRLKQVLTILLIIVSAIVLAALVFFGLWLLRSIEQSILSLYRGAAIMG
jgi:hypothetical protein